MSFKYGIEKQKGSHMGMLIYYLPVSLIEWVSQNQNQSYFNNQSEVKKITHAADEAWQ